MAEEPVKLQKGKFFYIVGQESGLVLEIQDAMLEPGTPIVLGEKRDIRDEPAESLCQMWYNCLVTNTVRSRANANLGFTLNDDDQMVIDVIVEEEGRYLPTERQKWQFNTKKGYIKAPIDGQMRFVEVADHGTDPGTPAIAYEETGDDNQKFDAEHLECPYFLIVSEMSGLCLEVGIGMFGGVKGGQEIEQSKIDGKENQLWYEDENGQLRLKASEFAVQVEGFEEWTEVKTSGWVRNRDSQHWHLMPNGCIRHREKEPMVWDVSRASKKAGAKIILWEYQGSDNQLFRRDFNIPVKKKKAKKSKKSKKSKKKRESDDDEESDDDDDDDDDDED